MINILVLIVVFHGGWNTINMKWKTKEGSVMDIKDMEDLHLINSIKYCEKTNNSLSCIPLYEEVERRNKERWFNEQMMCPFCGEISTRMECHNPYPEVGFEITQYRFVCNCGMMSAPMYYERYLKLPIEFKKEEYIEYYHYTDNELNDCD